MSEPSGPGLTGLIRAAVDDIANLARLDALLLRAEMKASLGQLTAVVLMGLAACVFGILLLAFLAVAAYAGLIAWGIAPAYSALILAAACGALALITALIIMSRLKRWSIWPTRTLRQVQTNLSALKASFGDARAER